MIGLYRVVRVALDNVECRGDQLIQNPRIGSGPVGSDLGRDRAAAQRPGEEPPGRCQVAALGQQYAKDLAMLINRPGTGRSTGRRPSRKSRRRTTGRRERDGRGAPPQ